jgi:hypothetical protein
MGTGLFEVCNRAKKTSVWAKFCVGGRGRGSLSLYLLTVIGLSPGGSTQSHTTIRSTTQIKIHRTTQLEKKKRMWNSAGRAPSKNASFTLAFALQLRKKHGKTSQKHGKNSEKHAKTSF